jgi:hypothetical protein
MQQPVARHELTPRVAPPKLLELHLELARHVVDTALLIAHAHVLSRDRELDIGPLVLREGPPTLAQHADDGHVVARLAPVHEVVLQDERDRARDGADRESMDLLLDTHLLVVSAHLGAWHRLELEAGAGPSREAVGWAL